VGTVMEKAVFHNEKIDATESNISSIFVRFKALRKRVEELCVRVNEKVAANAAPYFTGLEFEIFKDTQGLSKIVTLKLNIKVQAVNFDISGIKFLSSIVGKDKKLKLTGKFDYPQITRSRKNIEYVLEGELREKYWDNVKYNDLFHNRVYDLQKESDFDLFAEVLATIFYPPLTANNNEYAAALVQLFMKLTKKEEIKNAGKKFS
jgi:hypothetical protein